MLKKIVIGNHAVIFQHDFDRNTCKRAPLYVLPISKETNLLLFKRDYRVIVQLNWNENSARFLWDSSNDGLLFTTHCLL